MDYTLWTRTESGMFTRTKAAPIVPDFRCHADVRLCPKHGEKGLKATDDTGRLGLRILSSTADIDAHGEIVERSAFESSLEAYNALPILLAYHDMKQPVGLAPAKITPDGLMHPEAFVSNGRPDIQRLVLDGVLSKASIGFMVREAVWDEKLELVRITDLELLEVSLVPLPANRYTFVEAAKGWAETFGKAAAGPRVPSEIPKEEPARVPPLPMREISEAVRAYADSLRG
jgi:HK97 family phage prohead protease